MSYSIDDDDDEPHIDGDNDAASIAAIPAAKKREREQTDEGGWIYDGAKNPWRYKEGYPFVIEVLLPNANRITYIDSHRHIKDVAPYRWHCDRGYARTKFAVDEKRRSRFLHVHLFPEKAFPRDHVNRDALDNRDENIQSGANGLNRRNVELFDGGVWTDEGRKAYVAQWLNYESKNCAKSFYWRDFPDLETAKRAAREHRRLQADEAVAKIRDMQKDRNGIADIKKHVRKPRISNTGITGLHYEDFKGVRTCVRGRLVINKKAHTACFTISLYNTEEAALDAGRKWLAKIRAENPKVPGKTPGPKKRRKE